MKVLLKRKADANVQDNVSRGEGAPMDGPGVGILGVRIPLLTMITNEGLGLRVKVVVLIRELYVYVRAVEQADNPMESEKAMHIHETHMPIPPHALFSPLLCYFARCT